jgi:molybdopterin/thiamine biosynthesis adenylyltransferase
MIDTLPGNLGGPDAGYRPVIFDPLVPHDAEAMRLLLANNPAIEVIDSLMIQLKDVVKLEHPKSPLSPEQYEYFIAEKLGNTPPEKYGVWVYYPWRRTLAHVLPRDQFIRVRTIRNAYKITLEEQATLGTKKIGIIGLSVGQSASLAVAIERAAGELRIADFDTLELSNLNRIRSSICNLGIPKTHMVAREIAELDPFLTVRVWDDGIHENNIESFLTDGGKLDLLIEECDSVDIKVLAREYARTHRIPVLMDTSDRGMIDVERYDLDPDYPLLHGLLDPAVDYAFLKTLKTSEEKLPYVAPILGIQTMSIRLRASALEVGQSISTWPQLGGDVMHGGALCVHHAKEILLGRSTKSFRSYADELEIEKPSDTSIHRRFDDSEIMDQVNAFDQARPWDANGDYVSIDSSLFKDFVHAGTRASSPGNSQAFKWVWSHNAIFLVSDRSFEKAFSDNFGFGSLIGYGCIIENLEVYASSLGYQMQTQFNDTFDPNRANVIYAVRFKHNAPPSAENMELARQIDRRETTRIAGQEMNWTEEDFATIQQLAAANHGKIIHDPSHISAIHDLTLTSDIIRMTNPKGFHDLFHEEMVWSKEEYEAKREGIFIDDMNLNIKEKVGIEIYNNKKVNEFLNVFGGGSGFSDLSKKYLAGEPILCTFSTASFEMKDLIEAGRNIERFWLALTQYDYSLHPFTSSIMLGSYLHSDRNNYLQKEILDFSNQFNHTLQILGADRPLIFVAKITRHSGLEKASSLRKHFELNTLIDANSNNLL